CADRGVGEFEFRLIADGIFISPEKHSLNACLPQRHHTKRSTTATEVPLYLDTPQAHLLGKRATQEDVPFHTCTPHIEVVQATSSTLEISTNVCSGKIHTSSQRSVVEEHSPSDRSTFCNEGKFIRVMEV